MTLRTPLCDLLGIEHPIVQSGMGTLAGVELAAAVSEAGGLGILGSAWAEPQDLAEAIRAVRARTPRPFGVNVLMPDELRPPIDPASVPERDVEAVQRVTNLLRRELGLPLVSGRPKGFPDRMRAYLDVVLDARVPLLSVGLGNPGVEAIAACRERGIATMAMVTTVEDARAVETAGVDVVVAQGGEAGGHRSHFAKPASAAVGAIGTMTLVPQVVDAVRLPVLAAGGIADGRGLAAALALGAQGVLVGTRFVATREAVAPDAYKRAVLAAGAGDAVLTDAWSGRWARALRNEVTEAFAAAACEGVAPLPPYVQQETLADVVDEAARREDARYLPLWAGQGAGLVRDLPGAGEVVARMVEEARRAAASLQAR